MNLLLDVNGLIALVHAGHPDHGKARMWFASLPVGTTFHTCSITEIGFVRVSLLTKLCSDVWEARLMLAALLAQSRVTRLADDLGAESLPDYVRKPGDVTDGHLLALAQAHGARLATLDQGIPGARLVNYPNA